jgi:hypothetical protein
MANGSRGGGVEDKEFKSRRRAGARTGCGHSRDGG